MSQGQTPIFHLPYPNSDDAVTVYPAINRSQMESVERLISWPAKVATYVTYSLQSTTTSWVAVHPNLRSSVTIAAADAGAVDVELFGSIPNLFEATGGCWACASFLKDGAEVAGASGDAGLAFVLGSGAAPVAISWIDRAPAAGVHNYDLAWKNIGAGTMLAGNNRPSWAYIAARIVAKAT